jgi:hypothetical protein
VTNATILGHLCPARNAHANMPNVRAVENRCGKLNLAAPGNFMTPLDDIRNDLLRLSTRLLREGQEEELQQKFDLAGSLTVVAAAIDEQQLEQLALVLNEFAESAGMRVRDTAKDT